MNLTRRSFLASVVAGTAGVTLANSAAAALFETPEQYEATLKLIQLHDAIVAQDKLIDAFADYVDIPGERFAKKYVLFTDEQLKNPENIKFVQLWNEFSVHCNTFFAAPSDPELREVIHKEVAYLFNGGLDRNATLEERRESLQKRSDQFRDIPPSLTPVAAAIGAFRSMLAVHRVRVDAQNVVGFSEFASNYQEFILAA